MQLPPWNRRPYATKCSMRAHIECNLVWIVKLVAKSSLQLRCTSTVFYRVHKVWSKIYWIIILMSAVRHQFQVHFFALAFGLWIGTYLVIMTSWGLHSFVCAALIINFIIFELSKLYCWPCIAIYVANTRTTNSTTVHMADDDVEKVQWGKAL